jgi:NAD(P)-dependent dehydrogenase (short-subunit alcohol dehydrogenase family)
MGGYKSESVATKFSIGAAAALAAIAYWGMAWWQLVLWGGAALIVMRQISAGSDCKALQRKTNLSGKVCIVTGANAGIGYYTALQLAEMGAVVVITCRSAALSKATGNRMRADAAERRLCRAVNIIDDYSLECDDFVSIQNFVSNFLADKRVMLRSDATPQLDILVNNAGMMLKALSFSKFNPRLEMHTAVNFLGPVLLTELLMPVIKRSSGRVVNVASEAHRVPEMAKIAPASLFDALVAANAGSVASRGILTSRGGFRVSFLRYGMSKLMNIYYSHYVAAAHGVPVLSLHPGVVTTSFARDLLPTFLVALYEKLSLLWCKTSEEGSQTTVYAAICPVKELSMVLPERVAPYFVECSDQTRALLRQIGWSTESATRIMTDFALKELAPFLQKK